MDCTENEEICTEHGIRGYPTLKVYVNKNEREYSGERTSSSIVNTMLKATLPTVSKLAVNELASFNNDDYVIVGVGLTGNDAEVFEKFAELEDIKVAAIESTIPSDQMDLDIPKKFSAKNFVTSGAIAPGVYMITKFDNGLITFSDKTMTEELLSKWARIESLPTVAEVGPENYAKYLAAGLPMAYLFYENEEMKSKYASAFEKAASQFRGKFTAVFIDAEKFGAHAKALSLPDNKWPAVVVHDIEGDLKYPFVENGEMTGENLAKFFSGIANGSIEPTYRSQEVPEKDEEPIKTVVFKNFDDVVMDKSKDVLVEIYAPWCGACKRLAPIYEEVAKAYAPYSDKVIIAKLDGTENDLPKSAGIKLTKFPTFILFKAQSNEQVEMESPSTTVDGFIDFIKNNSVNVVDVKVESDKKEAEEENNVGKLEL